MSEAGDVISWSGEMGRYRERTSPFVLVRSKHGEQVPFTESSGPPPLTAGAEDRLSFESMSVEDRDSRVFLYGESSRGL